MNKALQVLSDIIPMDETRTYNSKNKNVWDYHVTRKDDCHYMWLKHPKKENTFYYLKEYTPRDAKGQRKPPGTLFNNSYAFFFTPNAVERSDKGVTPIADSRGVKVILYIDGRVIIQFK